MARRTRSDLIELHCRLPRALADRRLAERAHQAIDPSDATPAIAHRMADTFEPWPASTTIDTTAPVTDLMRVVLGRVGYPCAEPASLSTPISDRDK
jgi:predicted kinase